MSEPSTLSENRSLWIAAGAGVLIVLVLLIMLGVGGAVGVIGFAVYAAVWLAVAAFVLWLLYRFVVAVERIAHAHQRIAAAENPPSGGRATANRTTEVGDSETATSEQDGDGDETETANDDAESNDTAANDGDDGTDAA